MLKLLRWLGFGALGIVVLALLAVGVVLGMTQGDIDRRYPVTHETVVRASGPEAVARGRHLAVVLGCAGCHQEDLRGALWFQDAFDYPIYTANLTLKAKTYSDEDLARVIRRGVLPNGRGVNAMPSGGYGNLSDADTGDLIAFVRSVPAGGPERPPTRMGLPSRIAMLKGDIVLEGARAAGQRGVSPMDLGPAFAHGRYLASVVCAECHRPDLTGGANPRRPDLRIVGAYGEEDFLKLMNTGKAAGNREVGLMSEVARERFSHLSREDQLALYGYLKARAEK